MTARRPLTREQFIDPTALARVRPLHQGSELPHVQAVLRAHPNENAAKPGLIKSMLAAASPEDRARLMEGAHLYEHQAALGRHGDCDAMADRMEVDRDVARRLHEAFEVDAVCTALERRGSDADLPIEPPTRRDLLSAAMDSFDDGAPD